MNEMQNGRELCSSEIYVHSRFHLTKPIIDTTTLYDLSFVFVFFPWQWKVRRTLAFSIHEMALILGDAITTADLVPVFNGFLRDLDEVRIGVLKHFADFTKVSRSYTKIGMTF